MKWMTRVALFAAVLECGFVGSSYAQEAATPVDTARVYRFDPLTDELVAVQAEEIMPGYIYNRYSPVMNRRVWSLALEGGGFEYAMAPGSVQQARLLDLRATEEQLRDELNERAPALAKMMDIRGAVAHVRLSEDDRWELVQQVTIGSVFDLETSRRWEWHGPRRVAVMHTTGYEWMLVDGRFLPAVIYPRPWELGCRY
jgi:hypothetical protein